MLTVSKSSIVYILCPAAVKTGGPHALYQLCNELRKLGRTAYLVFVDHRKFVMAGATITGNLSSLIVTEEVTPAFPRYDAPQETCIVDIEDNVVIVPEVYPEFLLEFKFVQKVIWWLATWMGQSMLARLTDLQVTHLCQSRAASAFLTARGVKESFPLIDYVYLHPHAAARTASVAFNPAKGSVLTNLIRDALPATQFISIEKMTEEGVAKALRSCRVYIDFGHHPGRDRIPREAALAGCCILVAKAGTAEFFEDMPIPSRFKMSLQNFSPSVAADIIGDLIANYDSRCMEFEMYRRAVAADYDIFKSQATILFGCG